MTTPLGAGAPDQRARLARARLRAAARCLGRHDWVDEDLGGAAALQDGSDAVVQVGSGATGLGRALVWADRARLDGELHLVAEDDAGVLARRAGLFTRRTRVWRDVGGDLEAVEPAEQLPLLPPPEDALAVAEPLRALGAELVVEHGVVLAEILGLEVGRVVPTDAGGWSLEVGVGKHDREASVLMGALRSADEAIRNVVEVVAEHRTAAARPHLLNRLARPRWLRAVVLADPASVGAADLRPLEPPTPRANLVDPAPALALGRRPDGSPLVVACLVGVDLEAVPTAADARDRASPDAELVLAGPARDQYPPLRRLAELLERPARLVAVEGDWPR